MKNRSYFEMIPLAVMFIGFILKWLDVDPDSILLHIGFGTLGLTAIFMTVRNKDGERRMRILNLILNSLIVVLIVIHFIFNVQVIVFMVIALVLQYFITRQKTNAAS